MNLVLVSRLSLDELQNLAAQNFNEVENRNLPKKDFTNEIVFNRDHSFGRIFKIIPNKLIKKLELVWIMPASLPYSKKKSASYLAHVFGHEGPNSLLSLLIKQNLAISLAAGSRARLNYAFSQFYITVNLTENGEKNYKEVIEMVYQFIN